MTQRTKYIFVQERKAVCRLIKKLFLSFTQFSNNFITDHLLYYPQMSLFSFHTLFLLLYHCLRNGTKNPIYITGKS